MAETPSELLAEIEKLERKHLDNPVGRYFVPLANAYRKLGELEHAEARLREGLRTHPDYLSAHIVLGRVLADRGANVEAAEEFRYVLSVDPQNLIALRTLGELAMAEGRTEEAGRWYRELLGVDPMNDEARQALSELDARSATSQAAEPASAELEPVEEFEDGGWWTQPESPSEVGAATLAGLAPGPVDDWAGSVVDLDTAPPAVDAAQAYAGGLHGEFVVGGEASAASLVELPADEAPAPAPFTEFGDAGDYTPDFGDDDAEFVTETIAELYARQGFYDRAADVYRELIRQRGAESSLMLRLAEVERMAAGEEPVADPVPAIPMLEEFDFGAPDAAEPDRAGTEGARAPASDAFAASFAGGFGGFEDFDGEVAEITAAAAEPEAAAHAATSGATVAHMLGELLAWRAPAPAAPEEPVSEALPASTGFDEYFGADALAEESVVPGADGAAALEPLVAASDAPVAGTSLGDDEDLESFQAWLRSLKR